MRGNNPWLLILMSILAMGAFFYRCEASNTPVDAAIGGRFLAVWIYYWDYDPSGHPFTYFKHVLGMWWMGIWPWFIPLFLTNRLAGRNSIPSRAIAALMLAFTLFCVIALEVGALGTVIGIIAGVLTSILIIAVMLWNRDEIRAHFTT